MVTLCKRRPKRQTPGVAGIVQVSDMENPQTQAELIYAQYVGACYGQVCPDGLNCAICGSIDHQAFECPQNPFVLFFAMVDHKSGANGD